MATHRRTHSLLRHFMGCGMDANAEPSPDHLGDLRQEVLVKRATTLGVERQCDQAREEVRKAEEKLQGLESRCEGVRQELSEAEENLRAAEEAANAARRRERLLKALDEECPICLDRFTDTTFNFHHVSHNFHHVSQLRSRGTAVHNNPVLVFTSLSALFVPSVIL